MNTLLRTKWIYQLIIANDIYPVFHKYIMISISSVSVRQKEMFVIKHHQMTNSNEHKYQSVHHNKKNILDYKREAQNGILFEEILFSLLQLSLEILIYQFVPDDFYLRCILLV